MEVIGYREYKENNTGEFSFELKVSEDDSDNKTLYDDILKKLKESVNLHTSYLRKGETFDKYVVEVSGKELTTSWNAFEKLYSGGVDKSILRIVDKIGGHVLGRWLYSAEDFYNLPEEEQSKILNIFLQGITIRLQADIKNIDPSKAQPVPDERIEGDTLDTPTVTSEQGETAIKVGGSENKNGEAQSIAQNISPTNLLEPKEDSGKQVTRASVVDVAMRENAYWFGSLRGKAPKFDSREKIRVQLRLQPLLEAFKPSNFFNTVNALKFSFLQEPSPQAGGAVTDHPVNTEQAMPSTSAGITSSVEEPQSSHIVAGQTGRKKKIPANIKGLIESTEMRVGIAIKSKESSEKPDKIFIDTMNACKVKDKEILRYVFNEVFNIIYLQGRQINEVQE
ncbi:hypothetical protein [Wolbachia endosymbiont of Ctenocephalides felis wCfeT]|uniref:hypothetical protein n=1 Tax=Wolbachia endosymbiont of Ctenocephalides felis wCfeT TaxID=2732593 RepID=UPI00144825CC|nr:hypothetical protein [Wolbachia endosymbiont of Ctenocephalides felis wCfeT]